MSQTRFPQQDEFICECRHLKADLEAQAEILKSGPKNLGAEKLHNIAHEMTRLSHHIDKIIKLGLDMITNEPNCTGVLYSMQRTVNEIGFGLQKDPRKQLPTNMIKDLRDMAGVLETNLRLNES